MDMERTYHVHKTRALARAFGKMVAMVISAFARSLSPSLQLRRIHDFSEVGLQ